MLLFAFQNQDDQILFTVIISMQVAFMRPFFSASYLGKIAKVDFIMGREHPSWCLKILTHFLRTKKS